MERTHSAEITPAVTSRLSWAAIFGGAAVGLGVWLLLHILSMGIGMTAIDPDDPSTLRGVGIGTGIGSLLAPLIGLFVGGLVAGRVAGPMDRLNGAIHGAVLWALSAIAALTALIMVVGSIVSGAARTGGALVSSAGQAVGNNAGDVADALGLRSQDLIAPVNERLRAQGKPTITTQQVEAATQDVVRRGVREGRLDRDLLVQSIARQTSLSRADAEELATGVERRYHEQSSRLSDVAVDARTTALQAAETTGKGLMALFAALAMGLIAAVVGAGIGVTRAQRRAATRVDPVGSVGVGPTMPRPV